MVAVALSNLGWALLEHGSFIEAQACLQRALAIDEGLPQSDPSAIAVRLVLLASVEGTIGSLAHARSLLQRALQISEGHIEPIRLAEIELHLGMVEKELGNLTEAERLFRKAHRTREEALPRTHPDLGRSYACLAVVEYAL